MKKIVGLLLVLGVMALGTTVWAQPKEASKAPEAAQAKGPKTFNVYSDANAAGNHYIPSGWMGDTTDFSMDDKYMDKPHAGTTCIKFGYNAKKSQGNGWAGVYWQNPPNNWGSKKGGFDLTGMTKLTVWMKGAKGGEIIDKILIGGIKGTYPDSAEVTFGPFELKDSWQQYTINLAGKDLSYISGGFALIANADSNPNGATIFVDDIQYEADPLITPQAKKVQDMPFYVYADLGAIVNHFIPSGWMGDNTANDVKFAGNSKENPYFGSTCIKIQYLNNAAKGARWTGIQWQNPANNWGEKDAGFDLSKAKKLTFWARGEKGGENIQEFKIGGIMGQFSDSDSASIGPVVLTKEWKQYTIDLAGKDLSNIIGGFCWSTNLDVNPDGATFYLDEIRYE